MADRPILFSAPMVRAILDSRKTQTRRKLKPQPSAECAGFQTVFAGPPYFEALDAAGKPLNAFPVRHGVTPYPTIRFAKGDRLWTRETWQPLWASNDVPYHGLKRPDGWRIGYVATDGRQDWYDHFEGRITNACKPGIHMPRWASRLTLTVTDVRVERLQDISEADAIAEGIERRVVECADGVERGLWFGVPHVGSECSVTAYRDLWEAINNPRGLCADDEPKGWDTNPWVVVLHFTVAHRNIDSAPMPEREEPQP